MFNPNLNTRACLFCSVKYWACFGRYINSDDPLSEGAPRLPNGSLCLLQFQKAGELEPFHKSLFG